jgi:hypothetical protein
VTLRPGHTAARLAVCTALAAGAVVATPAAAWAHGVGGVGPSNYETVITSTRPDVPGVELRAVDLGDRLELTNDTERDVVVLGYDGEPYLRVGPNGTFENVRSPATYVNRTRAGNDPVPDRADSDAAPVWRKVNGESVARWHDHRSHWMARGDAPAVRADPDRPHVVQRFEVHLLQGDTPIVVRGAVRWVPGASPWFWIAVAFVLAALVVAYSRTAQARVAVVVALLGVIVAETLHVIGAWNATTEGTGTKVGASMYAVGAVVASIVAMVWVVRRGVHAAAPLVLIAGLFVAIAGGLADLSVLSRSQLPTTLSTDTARAIVATALGLGAGLAIVGALRLRPEPTRRRRDQAVDPAGDPGAEGPDEGAAGESWPSTQSWHSSSSVT